MTRSKPASDTPKATIRVSIERRQDLAYPGLTVHTFYVNYLLPISFDVHSQEPT